MKKIALSITGLSYSQTQSGAYALVLSEEHGNRRLPIIIGGYEAQAIAIHIEKMSPSRPLTHDLFKTFCDSFLIDLKEVIIYNLSEGIFYAKLVCQQNDANDVEIDARTSDAIALAVRFDCPIYTYEFILSSAGIVIDEEEDKEEVTSDSKPKSAPKPKDDLSGKTMEELQELLSQAIEEEAYEKAGIIRDEMKKRQ
ncbi:MAG: bifunctional nuclease domain-containing protein [Flavobacteriales bacterium]